MASIERSSLSRRSVVLGISGLLAFAGSLALPATHALAAGAPLLERTPSDLEA